MMWNVGAQKFGANVEKIYQLKDNMNWFLLDAVLRQPNLLINQRGDRFMNEDRMGNTTYTGNAIDLQPGNYAYCIMDDGILKYYKKNGPDIFRYCASGGRVPGSRSRVRACGGGRLRRIHRGGDPSKSWLRSLASTQTSWKRPLTITTICATAATIPSSRKNPAFLHPITGKGKYRVGKYYVAAYGTIGGVRVNKYCEVLDEQG